MGMDRLYIGSVLIMGAVQKPIRGRAAIKVLQGAFLCLFISGNSGLSRERYLQDRRAVAAEVKNAEPHGVRRV